MVEQSNHVSRSEEEMIKLKKMIVEELHSLIEKVESFNEPAISKDQENDRLILISLKKFSGELPREMKEEIKKYSENEWGSQNHFYVMTNRKRVVGYLGLNRYEESMPFGKYVCIFALQLEGKYQNKVNLKYIENFISVIARKAQCNYVDLIEEGCQLELGALKYLEFIEFASTSLIQFHNQENEIYAGASSTHKMNIREIESKQLMPSDRTLPLGVLLNRWKKNKCDIKKFVIHNNQDQEPLSIVIVREHRIHKNGDPIAFYTFLADSVVFYDEQLISQVTNTVIGMIVQREEDDIFMIAVPTEFKMLMNQSSFNNDLESVKWYRKVVIHHYNQS